MSNILIDYLSVKVWYIIFEFFLSKYIQLLISNIPWLKTLPFLITQEAIELWTLS